MLKHRGLKDKRILLVEDVELNQYLAKHIMESWGCLVDVADNGRKAVEKISDADYDLVLMDIQMPEMDGMQATKIIRAMQDEAKAQVPIVALTANALKTECEVYLNIGMNDWLAKPFEERTLMGIVAKNMKGHNHVDVAPDEHTIVVPASEKLYDLAMVESISGGDKTFIVKMMELFLQTVPQTLSDLKACCEKGDWVMTSKHAHKLKSTIDSMGIVSLKQDIRAIESGGKTAGDPAQLKALVQKVLGVMDEVISQVSNDFR
jgi:CheY-like chemotaxis protein